MPWHDRMPPSFAEDLDQDALRSVAVELAVEDLLPGPEIEPALGDRHDDLAAHDGAFQVGVGVVLAGAVVVVDIRRGIERGEAFQPHAEVVVQPRSSSLMKTLAVMCIALTSASPSLTPLLRIASSTLGVMLWKEFVGTFRVRYSVCDFMSEAPWIQTMIRSLRSNAQKMLGLLIRVDRLPALQDRCMEWMGTFVRLRRDGIGSESLRCPPALSEAIVQRVDRFHGLPVSSNP